MASLMNRLFLKELERPALEEKERIPTIFSSVEEAFYSGNKFHEYGVAPACFITVCMLERVLFFVFENFSITCMSMF